MQSDEKSKMVWEGLGFPVTLVGYEVKKSRDGEDVPVLNMNEIQEQAFRALIVWHSRFTGQHVRFVRSYLRETQTEFARNINQKHPSVVSTWEGKADEVTGMDINTELILRAYMQVTIDGPLFRKGVSNLPWLKFSGLFFDALKTLQEGEPLEISKCG